MILGPFVRISKKAGRRQQRSTQGFVTLLSDILIGIKPLKAMARQEHFLPLLARETGALRRALRRQAIGENMVNEMREPIFMVFAVVGLYVAQARFTVPMSELIVMAMLLYRTVGSLGRVQRQQQRAIVLEASHRAVHRADRRGRRASARSSPARGGRRSSAPACSSGCRSPSAPSGCWTSVSLTIPADRLTVLMGPSGVGKTTIADLLLGLYQPQGGRILLDGVPLDEIDLEAWRGMVGYVPQELVLFHDSVLANLTLGDPALGEADALAGAGDGGRRRLRRLAQGRPRDHRRRARHAALGRPAPAHRARPRALDQAAAADPRRGHERARPGDRGGDLRERPRARRRAHDPRDHPPRRPGSRSPTGSTRSARAACAW